MGDEVSPSPGLPSARLRLPPSPPETQPLPSSPGQARPPELPEEAAAVGVRRVPSVLSRSWLTGRSSGPLGRLPQEEVSFSFLKVFKSKTSSPKCRGSPAFHEGLD